MTKTAIVTLAIGEAYRQRFERLCRRNWAAYAGRHRFDLVVYEQPLDVSERARARSPAWQKCLVLGTPELAGYDRVVWVDSDILINPAASSILDGVPEERIGATDEHAFPSREIRQVLLQQIIAAAPQTGAFNADYWRGWMDAGEWHHWLGLPPGHKHIVQTGVLVMSPKHHREMLEHVYHAYEDRGFNYEMRPLSHEIQARSLPHWIDPRFNALVWWMFLAESMRGNAIDTEDDMREFLRDCLSRSYFLHFAGAAHLMGLLNPPSP